MSKEINSITVDNSFKWFVIWILVCYGDPDILDGIIKVLDNLGDWLLR